MSSILHLIKRVFKRSKDLYGLDHAVLNVDLPPQTMWMNMGYWEHTSKFPEACQALLDKVLEAGLDKDNSQVLRLLDVGCGCGDQSLVLTQRTRPDPKDAATYHSDQQIRSRRAKSQMLIDTYIGVTPVPKQAAFADQRVQNQSIESDQLPRNGLAKIFCADAAIPSNWTGELKESVSDLARSSRDPEVSTWLLALDSMYHFYPSRLPLLEYAYSSLHASFMAFDLMLGPEASWTQRLILRLTCWLSGTPFTNFLTREEYTILLTKAGYSTSRIEIRDISRHVFPGISKFLDERVKEGKFFGLNVRKFGVARMLFNWWGTTGVVKGIIVIARRS